MGRSAGGGREGGDDEQRKEQAAGRSLHDDLRATGNQQDAAGAETVAAHLPELARSLLPVLAKRGLTADEAADVMQEVLARAWANRGRFKSTRGLYRWAYVVARNLATTLQARKTRIGADELPDRAASPDIAELAQLRWEVDAVAQAFRGLSEQDRRTITKALQLSGDDDIRSPRGRKRLERARQRLRELMRGGVTGALVWRLRVRHEPPVQLAAFAGLGLTLVISAGVGSSLAGTSPATNPGEGSGLHEEVIEPIYEARLVDSSVKVASSSDSRNIPRGPGSASATGPGGATSPQWTVEVPWPVDHRRIDTQDVSAAVEVEAETRDKRPEDKLACLQNVPVAGGTCLDHIVR